MESSRSSRRSQNRWDPDALEGTPFSPLSWGACVVEVELNAVSLEIAVRGIWFAFNVGVLLDESLARRAMESELIDIFNVCCNGEIAWKSAGTHSSDFAAACNSPALFVRFLPGKKTQSGALEGLVSSTFAPAFVSAVSQATGFYYDCLPLSRSLILQYAET